MWTISLDSLLGLLISYVVCLLFHVEAHAVVSRNNELVGLVCHGVLLVSVWLVWLLSCTYFGSFNSNRRPPLHSASRSTMEGDTSTSDEVLLPQDEAEGDVPQCESKEVVDAESSLPGPLRREHVTKRLSVLGRNPFTQAHIYTTATLTTLHLSDIEAIREFPHIQVREPRLDNT